jgi:DME family drug/metabolite transporter
MSCLPSKSHPLRGYCYIAASTFFWGISAALGRAAFTGRLAVHAGHVIDPLILAQTRSTFAVLMLLPALLLVRQRSELLMPRRDIVRCLVLGVLGIAASNYFYYLAIQKTNVATAIILQYTAPVWVLLYMVGRREQRATPQKIAAVGLAVIGCALAIGIIGGGGFLLNPVGISAALLAALSFSFYNVGGHRLLAVYDRWKVLLYVLLGAALSWLVINPPWKIVAAHYSGGQWLFLLIFSVTSVLLPFPLYFAGLQHLDATRAVVTSCLEPVFSILITAIALGELVRPVQAVGIVVVLLATVLVQLPEKGREPLLVEPIE